MLLTVLNKDNDWYNNDVLDESPLSTSCICTVKFDLVVLGCVDIPHVVKGIIKSRHLSGPHNANTYTFKLMSSFIDGADIRIGAFEFNDDGGVYRVRGITVPSTNGLNDVHKHICLKEEEDPNYHDRSVCVGTEIILGNEKYVIYVQDYDALNNRVLRTEMNQHLNINEAAMVMDGVSGRAQPSFK